VGCVRPCLQRRWRVEGILRIELGDIGRGVRGVRRSKVGKEQRERRRKRRRSGSGSGGSRIVEWGCDDKGSFLPREKGEKLG
jgi:hypothetical protein